jgi:hypothetical protein
MKKKKNSKIKKVEKHLKGDHKTWKMFERVAKKEDRDDKKLRMILTKK